MMGNDKVMRVLVIGCGSIGMRHMRNLKSLGIDDLMAFDTVADRRERAQQECSARPFDSFDAALRSGADVAFVTTPTHLHVPIALQAARAGCHLFIEKPLSHTLEGVDELLEVVKAKSLVSLVGCNMRFHHGPATIKRLLDNGAIGRIISATLDAGQYMPDWHPGLDYRQRYSAHRSMGGGVVLDGIHEVDYARWLFGEVTEVFCYGGKLSDLDIDVEDSANILMKFEAGFSAMIHIDYIQRAYARSCKVIGEEGTIVWDITAQLRWFSVRTKQWNVIEPPENYTINDMYLEELRHYLDCVEQGEKTVLDVEEAAHVTLMALAIKQSMDTGQRVLL